MMKYRYRNDDEMKDSGVEWLGKIPKGWGRTKLKYLANIKTGYTPSKADKENYSEGGVVWVKPDDLNEFVAIKSSKERISDKGLKKQNLIPQNSVLVCCIGSIGKFGINKMPVVTNQQINALIFNNKCFEKIRKYLIAASKEEHNKYANGNVVKILNGETQGKIIFALSPHQEQQKIASFLDKKTSEFDTIIEKKQSLITKLTEAKKSLISEVVTGKKQVIPPPFDKGEWKLRDRSDDEMKDSGVEWLGKIPVEWAVSKLRYLGFTKNGISAGSDYFGSGYPFVSYGDVYKDIELPTEVKGLAKSTIEDQKNYSIEDGDVLFTRTSETIEEVGFSSTCMKTIEKSTFAGFLIRFRPIKNKLLKGFSKYYFSSSIHRSYFVKNMNLVTRASLSQELLKGLYVILPNLQEQQLIVNFLDEKTVKIDSTIAKVKLQIEKLKEAKQSLISEVVTGKIEVL